MTIHEATTRYERWLGKRLTLNERELGLKHDAMAADLFAFFRATYYRWAQIWVKICPELQSAPACLSVGDLHVENFGTWRDKEGRLVWGINDFDEAWELPYPNDLVRLAASAGIAGMAMKPAAAAILNGYQEALAAGGRPLVLAENNLDLRNMAVDRLKDPGRFWAKLNGLPAWQGKVPKAARAALAAQMPERGLTGRIVHRVAGLGSLGRARFAALAECQGGLVAREAKALAPSACAWAESLKRAPGPLYQLVLDQAVRSRDPFVRMRDGWVVRRLAPDCSRIELSDLPRSRDEERLLFYMAWETANVHLGAGRKRKLLEDLGKTKPRWLEAAGSAMVEAVKRDWRQWRNA